MIRVWRFPEGIDPATAPDGTEYDTIFAPDQFNHTRWRKVRFQVVVKETGGRQSGRWHRVIKQRYLTDAEVQGFLEKYDLALTPDPSPERCAGRGE